MFHGTASKWRVWKVVTSSSTEACHAGLAGLMTKGEQTEEPVTNATLVKNDAHEARKPFGDQFGDDMPCSCAGPGGQRRRPV